MLGEFGCALVGRSNIGELLLLFLVSSVLSDGIATFNTGDLGFADTGLSFCGEEGIGEELVTGNFVGDLGDGQVAFIFETAERVVAIVIGVIEEFGLDRIFVDHDFIFNISGSGWRGGWVGNESVLELEADRARRSMDLLVSVLIIVEWDVPGRVDNGFGL